MPAPPLAIIEAVVRQILEGHRQRERLLTQQEAFLYSEGTTTIAMVVDELRQQVQEIETYLLQACAALRALGARIVFRDPLTIAVPGLPREETRFLRLDGGMAHITLVPEVQSTLPQRHSPS